MRNRIEDEPPALLVGKDGLEIARQACAANFLKSVIIPEYEHGGYDVEIDFPALLQSYQEENGPGLGMDFSLEDLLDKLKEYVFNKGEYGDLNLTLLVRTFYQLSNTLVN